MNQFSHEQLPELFENIKQAKSISGTPTYWINEWGRIDYVEVEVVNDIWRFSLLVQKKFYQTNFPFTSAHQFKADMKRIGIEVIRTTESALKEAEGLINFAQMAFSNMSDFNNEKGEGIKISEFKSNTFKEYFAGNVEIPVLMEAARLVVVNQLGSTSLLQRYLKLGFNMAQAYMDQLEALGIVGKFLGNTPREIKFKTVEDLNQFLKEKKYI